MATIDWPEALIPQTAQLALRKAGTQFASPFNGTLQALDFIGERWTLSCTLAQTSARRPRGVGAFCNLLAGGVERVRVWPFHTGGVPRGTMRGTPSLTLTVNRGATGIGVANAVGEPNLLRAPQSLNAGVWTGAATVVADTYTAPDGTLTAEELQDTSTTATQLRSQAVAVPADTTAYTFSAYVRKTSGGTQPTFSLQLTLTGGTTQNNNPRFNTDTGAFLPGIGLGVVQDAGDYWRVSASIVNNGTNTLITAGITPTIAAYGLVTADVTITGSAVAWGAQLERGAVPSTYAGEATLRAGDFVGAGGQLFQVATDTVFVGGAATIPVINRVRATIASGSLLTWYRPTCEMVLPAMQAGPVYRPGAIDSTALDLMEVW